MSKDHLYKPGQTGNANGRPKDKTPATIIRKAIADAMPEILAQLVEQAKSGNVTSAKVLVDRVCPPLKPQAMPINLPVNGTLADQGAEIIRATLAGQIPPDIGAQLITALSGQSKIIEMQEMADRLERIQQQLEQRRK
ncbi:DUF5681 domain-containing protein [Methylomicrobium sp. Wu6]|uniref:DUF5681 domain-containing protein n=1 Tax=Methylomicrobium sp. Wu6 TaxID=3107928 RepID=UPI002DD66BB2|nr:DUF5681 domain-containing protein [Methylomicrobium sp. Wu6]MEC4749079.1 hypothetical protein [Methylomicrobium sp. Wu6]